MYNQASYNRIPYNALLPTPVFTANISDNAAVAEQLKLLQISAISTSETVGSSEALSFLQISFIRSSETIANNEFIQMNSQGGISVSDGTAIAELLRLDEPINTSVADALTSSETLHPLLVSDVRATESTSVDDGLLSVDLMIFLQQLQEIAATENINIYSYAPVQPIIVTLVLHAKTHTLILPEKHHEVHRFYH